MAKARFTTRTYFDLAKRETTAHQIDHLLSAEIPDPEQDKELHDIIVKKYHSWWRMKSYLTLYEERKVYKKISPRANQTNSSQ